MSLRSFDVLRTGSSDEGGTDPSDKLRAGGKPYQIVNTADWSYDQLAPYGRDITAAMRKLAEKFPQDVSVAALAHECLTGQRQLWLILDASTGSEPGAFVSFCATAVNTVDATGTKIVTLTSHAGAEGLPCVADMCRVIEAWAKEQGAQFTAAEGRRGWGRELARHGYREYAVIWRKPV